MRDAILKIIHDQVDYQEPLPVITEDRTFTDIGADSLDVIEMIMEIEDQLDITITDDIFEKTNTMTIGEFITYVLTIERLCHGKPLQDTVAGRC